ncbi:hypothetical protein COB57_06320, partial [Candidatus Peregrinibacteria bacterium]
DGLTSVNTSTAVTAVGLTGVDMISTARSSSFAVLSDGTLKSWGDNGSRELGDGTTTDSAAIITATNAPTLPTSGFGSPGLSSSNIATGVTLNGVTGSASMISGSEPSSPSAGNFAYDSDGILEIWSGSEWLKIGKVKSKYAIAMGYAHSCVVLADETVKCWGKNSSGQLGNGSTTNSNIPVVVSSLTNVASLGLGQYHSCALITDGTVKCWGENGGGQLGDASTTDRLTPVVVTGLTDVITLTGGGDHTCVSLSDQTVKCWGYNGNGGQLGDGTTTSRSAPVLVSGVTSATAVVTGRYHSCALLSDKTVTCWGYNGAGQLGDTTFSTRPTAALVTGLTTVESLFAGGEHNAAILSDGSVKMWGKNTNGQLGNGATTNSSSILTLAGITNPIVVSPGRFHTCVLLSDGTANCMGRNSNGQLGNNSTSQSTSLVTVDSLTNVGMLFAGGLHNCAVVAGGSVKCWGNNSSGEMGDASTTTRKTPVSVTGLTNALAETFISAAGLTSENIVSGVTINGVTGSATVVSGSESSSANVGDFAYDSDGVLEVWTGSEWVKVGKVKQGEKTFDIGGHSCVVLEGGSVKCWGENHAGQLGDGTTTNSNVPVSVLGITSAKSLEIKQSYSCALLEDNTMKCWGYKPSEVSMPGIPGGSTPGLISSVANIESVGIGSGHMCFLITDGTVECMGYDAYGQLGNDVALTSQSSFVVVDGITTATLLATGTYHNCVILADTTVKCWGLNQYGAIGDNDMGVDKATPVAVVGLTGVKDLALGWEHSCALLNNGQVKCWGRDLGGRLGDNLSDANKATPVSVYGISDAQSISSENQHTCVVVSGGKVKCWGQNSNNGELGDNSFANQYIPVSPVGVENVYKIAAGDSHTCALLQDGTIECWGSNHAGQLGDGTTTSRATAVSVSGISTAKVDVSIVSDGLSSSNIASGVTLNGVVGSSSMIPAAAPSSPSNGDYYTGAGGSLFVWTGSAWYDAGKISVKSMVVSGTRHACAVLSDATVKCWGSNTYGTLGDGSTTDSSTPVMVSGLTAVTGLALGNDHTCAVLSDNTVKCWGKNNTGQFGNGLTANSTTPLVSLFTGVSSLSAGSSFTCALLIDQTVKCSGENASGELGDTTTTLQTSPVFVSTLSSVVSIDTKYHHSCALLSDNTVKCWGYNFNGQLGDGTTVTRTSPVVVSGLTGVKISVSYNSSCAVLSDATVKCWGGGSLGTLGNGSTSDSYTPVSVSGVSSVLDISGGGDHFCAILSNGTVKCWGRNIYGQLGDGTQVDRLTAVSIIGITHAVAISGGRDQVFITLSDGSVQGVGRNTYGQLGNATTTSTTSIVTASGITTASGASWEF